MSCNFLLYELHWIMACCDIDSISIDRLYLSPQKHRWLLTDVFVQASLRLSCMRFENGVEGNSRCERFRRKTRKLSTSINIVEWSGGYPESAVIARVLNKNALSWQTRNNRKLPKHKLSQNAKNLQCLLKFELIEDNVTVLQWSWNSESE